jgi:hypothetical protein
MLKHRALTGSLFLAVTFLPSVAFGRHSENSPPQRQLKKYELHGQVHAADISPDEKLVAIQVTRSEAASDLAATKYVELAQLWDFRQDRMLAEVSLEEVVYTKASPRRALLPPRFVRFSPDGGSVLVYLDYCLHVLKADDLHEERSVRMDGPPATDQSEAALGMPWLPALEISPHGHEVAVVWSRSFLGAPGLLEVYDFDSGERLKEWNAGTLSVGLCNPTALAWEPDGQHLVVAAVPEASGCSLRRSHSNIFVVDASSGRVTLSFATGLHAGAVALTTDARLWVVNSDQVRLFANHNPKMKVFDLRTGKRLKEISGRGSGVRYAIAASRNGDRIVAYTGRMRVRFDWLDAVAWGVPVDHTFSVWNAHDYDGLVTSQELWLSNKQWESFGARLNLRLSSNGRFALLNTSIYELPDDSERK